MGKNNVIGTVLICEDNITNQVIIGEGLRALGVNYQVSQNGAQAVADVETRMLHHFMPFDLILMDIQMPVMDGLTAAGKIRASGCLTPIIAMSSSEYQGTVDRQLPYGITESIHKPFSHQTLWSCVEKYLIVLPLGDAKDRLSAQELQAFRLKSGASFLKHNKEKALEIEQALCYNDFATAQRLAHSLKGVAGMMDFTALHFAAAKIEFLLAKQEVPAIADLAHLKSEMSQTVAYLQHEQIEQGQEDVDEG